ncbi:hypothetical protein BDN72DRAFT_955610 [Pluteus cervinus]|uniref:Uncharacterized protein n=1 Tax=Pluteus cervinus TaxID=181527 RepID=A0ACD3BAD2_9AGAR|nr:hypothetical protein BDN72DRAFT_955610 [Pluteus cervinus]
MRERKGESSSGSSATRSAPLPLYESHPPNWLPKAHLSADLGYPGFHPPRPGQEEDLLSEANVRHGFTAPQPVNAEHFSAQSMINDSLHSEDVFSKLEELMNEVFLRKAERLPGIPTPSFRIPTRVTLNDAKRQAWLADLANPDVPLHKLGKSVPHGAKGHDLLDLLHSNDVAIPRAVWFLRVLGANETAGLRNRPTYNPTQYSIDWANLVTSYMKKQLTDIALPSAPRPGLNIKQTFKGVLSDADSRERWISRFSYCLKLLRTFYSEGLVDKRTFLVWVVQQMATCNLAQAGFITRLADEYLDGIVCNRALTKPLAEACLCKLNEVRVTSAQEHLADTEQLIISILQRICLAIPDAFVSPRLWSLQSNLIQEALGEDILDHPKDDKHIEQCSRDIRQLITDNVSDIQRRNDAMLFRKLPPHISTNTLGSAVSDVKLLNSISSNTDLSALTFFGNDSLDSSAFADKLNLLLTWSITPLQYGDHRPLACVTLLRLWRDKANERASRRSSTPPDEFLQDQLFDWLDSSDVASQPDNIRDIALLYGKLVGSALFSYVAYIQRLIARGEMGLEPSEGTESPHRKFLLWIPLSDTDPALTLQRKMTLYGPRARETPEDANERAIRKEIRLILPELFGGEALPTPESTAALLSQCAQFVSATRYEQVRTFRLWLLPIIKRTITNEEPGSSHPTLLKTYSVVVELMTYAKCFHTLLDMTLAVLEHCVTNDLLTAVIETLQRFSTVWACMDAMNRIVPELDNAHQLWRGRGVRSRTLLDLLLEFDNGRYLSDVSRQRVVADVGGLVLALQPVIDQPIPVPDILSEIFLLSEDTNPKAPLDLATGLWIKYRSSADWAWKVWDSTFASLRQVPNIIPDAEARRASAIRYGTFLCHIDQHLPHGMDHEVLQWFEGPGQNDVLSLSAEMWEVLTIVLLHLSIHGALKTTTILRGLVYPAWNLGASTQDDQSTPAIETLITASNNLCKFLLLQDVSDQVVNFPLDLLDVQCIRTHRREVFLEPHFSLFVSSIPILILLEHNPHIPEHVRENSSSLRQLLCQDRDCRKGAHRNLVAIQDAFEQSLHVMDQNADDVSKSIVSGLATLLGDSTDDIDVSNWPAITCLLSPWKIASTTLQFQFLLRQMGRALPQDASAGSALDKLTLMIFRNSMSSEEAYYVAQMVRGVDGAVAEKFVNNGIRCMGEMLKTGSLAAGTLTDTLKRASELLRVLVHVAEPLRKDPTVIPTIESATQDNFFPALASQLSTLEGALTSNQSEPGQYTQEIILLARLLQFDLGFRGVWTNGTKNHCGSLSLSLYKLTLLYGTGDHLDLIAYPLLFDTLIYLLDEIPLDIKSPTADPFRHYPTMSPTELPFDLPQEFRAQIMTLLPHLPPNDAVANLVTSHRDAAGNLIHGAPVTNRPWEWIENLGEPPISDPKEEERERDEKARLKTNYLIKNSGSLPLETFAARLTGDGVPGRHPDINLRCFEDGLSGESIFKRDWRETRIELDISTLSVGTSTNRMDEDHDGIGGSDVSMAGIPYSSTGIKSTGEKRPPSRGSPASSVVSRSSARNAGSSMRFSPSHRMSVSTMSSEVIDVDAIGTANSGGGARTAEKRKATGSAASDDEIEIIEGPVTARPTQPAAKKQKVRAATKTKAKKK